MRRVITTLVILLVVVVAGMSALVLLVNPNDFRTYMTQQVEQRSGYKLALNGDLRWHVWPQLSILTGRMSLTAPGAAQPVVLAENMRLDVNLLPLLSHQLSVSQVMLKSAVIRVTPDSEAQQPKGAPIGPRDAASDEADEGWSYAIDRLQIADSLLIWQQPDGDEFNFRDLNIDLEQDRHMQAKLDLSLRTARNQRTLALALKGQLDLARYPALLRASIDQMEYTLSGANLPPEAISGKASLQGEWQAKGKRFSVNALRLQANESQLEGSISGTLRTPQSLRLDLRSPLLDFDKLLDNSFAQADQDASSSVRPVMPPVIAVPAADGNVNSLLNAQDIDLTLRADSAVWRGLTLNNLLIGASNRQGLITVSQLQGELGEGRFSVPATLDVRQPQTHVALRPQIENVAAQPLLKALLLPEVIQGLITVKGELAGDELSLRAAKRQWRGHALFSATDVNLARFNIQQMVEHAVARATDRVSNPGDEEDQGLRRLEGGMRLDDEVLRLTQLYGESGQLQMRGEGSITLPARQLDITLGVLLSGWTGNDRLVQALSKNPVPLRLYGPRDSLQYQLEVDRVLRQQLRSEAKSRFNQWLQRQPADAKAPSGEE